jgi:hypothetical protein
MGLARRCALTPDGTEMHLNSNFSAGQILWTLNFAAQLVLLVVLLGRDRIKRFPCFTAGIGLMALRLLIEELLAGRMAKLPFEELVLALADVSAIVGLLVVVEVARRAFAGASRNHWIVNTVGLVLVACGVLKVLGPWPAMKDLALDTLLGKLKFMQLVAVKGETLVALLTLGVGVLVVFFGRRFKAGWRSHTQQIAIGLSTVAMAMLTAQTAVQYIVRTVHPQSKEEYDRVVGLISKLMNGDRVVYIAMLLWWIIWLWLDDPRTQAAETAATETVEPEAAKE